MAVIAAEEARALAYRQQEARRLVYQQELWQSLAGDPVARRAVFDAWAPILFRQSTNHYR